MTEHPPVRARSFRLALAAALALIAAPSSTLGAPPVTLGGTPRPPGAHPDTTDACLQASDEGQVLRDQGKLIAARARFLTCARESCPRLVRTDCVTWLADAEARTPSVVLSAQDPEGHDTADVTVTLDGAPLADHLEAHGIPVDPGQHLFRFERAGSPPVDEAVILREGEQRRAVAARFRSPGEGAVGSRPRPRRDVVTAAVALGGVAVVGGSLFAYLAATAESAADHLRATCAPSCNPADVSAIRTREIAANVSLGLGLSAAAAGLGAVLFGPWEAPPLAPAVARVPGGGVVMVGGRF